MMRWMRHKCSNAASKSTNVMGFSLLAYSSSNPLKIFRTSS